MGDNIGYLVARKGGRRPMQRPGPLARQRRRVLEAGEPFFERHGPTTTSAAPARRRGFEFGAVNLRVLDVEVREHRNLRIRRGCELATSLYRLF